MTSPKRPLFSRLPTLGELLRKNFFAGILVLIPMAVILWLGQWVLNILWGLHKTLFGWLGIDSHSALFNGGAFLVATFTLALCVSILGWISKLYLGQKLLSLLGAAIQRIPILGTIYASLDQLIKTLGAGNGQQFSRVVLIEFPRKEIWAVAFVTSTARYAALPAGYLNVFVPTVPNPTGGFHMIIRESDTKESGLTVEAAFKLILSLGIAQPQGPGSHEPGQ